MSTNYYLLDPARNEALAVYSWGGLTDVAETMPDCAAHPERARLTAAQVSEVVEPGWGEGWLRSTVLGWMGDASCELWDDEGGAPVANVVYVDALRGKE